MALLRGGGGTMTDYTGGGSEGVLTSSNVVKRARPPRCYDVVPTSSNGRYSVFTTPFSGRRPPRR